jgi:hypothetical protein
MRVSNIVVPAFCLALGLGATMNEAHAYNQRDAIRDCERHLQRSYHYRPDQVHDVSVHREGRGSFEIRGRLRLENLSDPKFSCIIHHREVVSLRIDNAKAAAEAIGKGILGAVLGGIASSLERSMEEGSHAQPHPAYSGQGSPFHDETFMKNACKHELRRHLRVGHGPVEGLRLMNAHLHHRTLDGDGVVHWRDGARQRIHFTCEFDRYGRIHDGRYSYYGSVSEVTNLPADPPMGSGGNDRHAQVRQDCIRAVRRQVGGNPTSVIRIEPGENFFIVSLRVEGAQAPWICEHSSREVMRVYYGSEG